MKSFKYYFIFLFIFCIPFHVFAMPKTFERTMDDLRLPEGVKVDGERAQAVLKVPSVDEQQKIYDFSDSLTEEEESHIYKMLINYTNETMIDSVIVFTNDLLGFSLSEYAYYFYDYNAFTKEGIILLVHLGNEKCELFMGNSGKQDSRVFEVYSDARIEEVLKYLYNKHIDDNQYAKLCEDYIVLTRELYFKLYGNYVINENGKIISDIPWIDILVIAVSLTFIIVVLVVTKYGTKVHRKNTVVKDSVNQTNMVVKNEYDRIIEKEE